VLPIEIAAFKHYTRKVIENGCTAYSDAQLPGITLRRTVAWMGPGHPNHSTLHGWLGGLGERVLGRLDKVAALPLCALIAETARHHGGDLTKLWARRYPVVERKYRSERRADQLEGCARVFAAAAHVFLDAAHPLFEWEKELQDRLHVAAWTIPARSGVPSFQQPLPPGSKIQCASSGKDHRKPRKEKSHGARSPP